MAKLTVSARRIDNPSQQRTQCAVVPVFEKGRLGGAARNLDKATGGSISDLIALGDFSGKRGQSQLLAGSKPVQRILRVGCGERDKFDRKAELELTQSIARAVKGTHASDAVVYLDDLPAKAKAMRWLLPALGLRGAFLLLVALNAIAGAGLVLAERQRQALPMAGVAVVTLLFALIDFAVEPCKILPQTGQPFFVSRDLKLFIVVLPEPLLQQLLALQAQGDLDHRRLRDTGREGLAVEGDTTLDRRLAGAGERGQHEQKGCYPGYACFHRVSFHDVLLGCWRPGSFPTCMASRTSRP